MDYARNILNNQHDIKNRNDLKIMRVLAKDEENNITIDKAYGIHDLMESNQLYMNHWQKMLKSI